MSKTDKIYTKSTDELPEENVALWVRICGARPRKMFRLDKWFFYYNKELFNNGNIAGIGEGVLWRYCKN